MKANATIVAKGIAFSDCDENVKKCLLALFNFELENTNVKNPPYKEKYRDIIDLNSQNWSAESAGNK